MLALASAEGAGLPAPTSCRKASCGDPLLASAKTQDGQAQKQGAQLKTANLPRKTINVNKMSIKIPPPNTKKPSLTAMDGICNFFYKRNHKFLQNNPLNHLFRDLFIAQRLHSEGSPACCRASNFARISEHLGQGYLGINYTHISMHTTIYYHSPFA
jgi:hypothetical protein